MGKASDISNRNGFDNEGRCERRRSDPLEWPIGFAKRVTGRRLRQFQPLTFRYLGQAGAEVKL
jgi:hypothetical protein